MDRIAKLSMAKEEMKRSLAPIVMDDLIPDHLLSFDLLAGLTEAQQDHVIFIMNEQLLLIAYFFCRN